MTRIIKGLKWARALAARPKCIPVGRPRGAKAAGLRYERALAAALPSARHGQWFEFEDAAGLGYCQVDLILALPSQRLYQEREGLLVLEAKYTWTIEGHHQIEYLYVPVLEKALGCRVLGAVVAKRLIPGVQGVAKVVGGLEEAVQWAPKGRTVLHWLGKGPVAHAGTKDASATPYICAPQAPSRGIIPASPQAIRL